MEDMETPAPTPGNNEGNENEDDINIEIDSESYKLTIYIEFTSLVILLEPKDNNPDKILQNSFNIAELKNMHKSLKGYDNLEDIKEALLDNFRDKKPKIQKNEKVVTFIFNISKQNLSISLKKIDKDNELSYDSLSEEMKKIINDNELILGID